MRVFIFGNKGQLGRDLTLVFAEAAEVLGADLPEVDIASGDSVSAALGAFAPDLVINAAAYTNVEGAEDDRDGAFKVNELGARVVAEAAARANLPVVYYSTDFVFRGDSTTPYDEDEPIEPNGVYAESKAAGEAATGDANDKHFIIRTAWLYGPGGNNFVEKIIRAAQTRPELKVVDDEVGSPTHTLDLAKATAALVQTSAYGTYHAVNEGACSRYEFAQTFLKMAGLDTPVHPCKASEFPSKAPRPSYSVLSNEKLCTACGFSMPPWEDALATYMKRRENHQ